MAKRRLLAAQILLYLVAAAAVARAVSPALAVDKQQHRPANKSESVGGLFWSIGKAEGDFPSVLDPPSEGDESVGALVEDDVGAHAELDEGFSSLESMLQWAIGHSEPEKLKEKAKDVQKLSEEELKNWQAEIKELTEKLKMPSDSDLMQTAIADLKNSSISVQDRQRILGHLLILVESIDIANDLHKHGGLAMVIGELKNSEPDIRTIAAWILGKASQNNAYVQNQILELGALAELMKMVSSMLVEEAVKALYAISALIRNNEIGQQLFCSGGGNIVLQEIMINSSIDIRIVKKTVLLVADLADYKLYSEDASLPFLGDRDFLKAVVDLMLSPDLDLQEKALLATRSLLQLSSTDAAVFNDFCVLDAVLGRMEENFKKLMKESNEEDYAKEIEDLRREVHIIFQNKLRGNLDSDA